MFTGIIQEVGKVVEVASLGGGIRLTVDAPASSSTLKTGDSVSVNGVCQTVVERTRSRFSVVAVEETLQKTTLASLKPNAPVNLELPLQLGDRLGGHIVSGHVDCVGEIVSILQRDTSRLYEISLEDQFQRYVIPVGSIAIDGASLTVASIGRNVVTVSIIPYTLEMTIFSEYLKGSKVNLEFDMIGKYAERLLGTREAQGGETQISADQLKSWGYDVS